MRWRYNNAHFYIATCLHRPTLILSDILSRTVSKLSKIIVQIVDEKRRGESSDDCRMWTETVWILRAVVDRSTQERRRRGKFCRRWLTGAYGGRPVMMSRLNEGDVARWNPPTGRVTVHQQGTTVLLHVSTCIQGQQAWSQFASPRWASAADGGAEWCDRTSMKKTPAGQPSSS